MKKKYKFPKNNADAFKDQALRKKKKKKFMNIFKKINKIKLHN